jgi:hypothetical protein
MEGNQPDPVSVRCVDSFDAGRGRGVAPGPPAGGAMGHRKAPMRSFGRGGTDRPAHGSTVPKRWRKRNRSRASMAPLPSKSK